MTKMKGGLQMWQSDERPLAKSRDMDLLVKKTLELGRKPTFREVEDDPKLPNANNYAFYYGSFAEAVDVAWAMVRRKRAESIKNAAQNLGAEVSVSAEPEELQNMVSEEHRWLAWLVRLRLRQHGSSDEKLDYYYVKKLYPQAYQRILSIMGNWRAVESKLAEFKSTDYLAASKGLNEWLTEMQEKLGEGSAKRVQKPQRSPRKTGGGRPRKRKIAEAKVAEEEAKNVVKNTETEVVEVKEASREAKAEVRTKEELDITTEVIAPKSKWSQAQLVKEVRATQIARGLGEKMPSRKQLEEHLRIYGNDGPTYKDFLEVLGPKRGWNDLF